MITIEKAKLEDLNNILEIEQLVFKSDCYPPFVIRQLYDISGHLFFVAKEENNTLGFIIGGLNTSQKQGWILSLGVHPEARGKGLGKKLTHKLITVLKDKHTQEICLTVYPDNKSAIKIYESLGFVGDKVLDNYFLDNEKRIIMTLQTRN